MAYYVYEGQHFQLPDGLSNEQAISKIKAHLGQAEEPTPYKGAGWDYAAYSKDYEDQAAKPQVPGHIRPPKMSEEEFKSSKDKDLIDKILGVPESLLTLGTGMFAALNAVPGAIAKGIKEGSTDAMEKEFNRLSEEKTWTPRTEYGQKLAANLAYGLQAFGPMPYVMRPALPKNVRAPKLNIEERLAQAEKEAAATKAAEAPTPKDVPLEFTPTDLTDLVPKEETPFRYEGAIDAPELLNKDNIQKTFDPREEAAAKRAAEERQVYENMDPEIIQELKRPEPALAEEAFAKMEAEQARQKKLEEQAAWAAREEGAVERAKERGRQANMEEILQRLEEDLSQERVSKGQQRKLNNQRGVIDVEAITDSITKLRARMAEPNDVFNAFKGTFDSRELEAAKRLMENPTGRERIVLMSPDDFHRYAKQRTDSWMKGPGADEKQFSIRVALQRKEGLRDIPWLGVDKDGQVTGHEGRHRMDVFKDKGIDLVPVRVVAHGFKFDEGTPRRLIPEDAKDFTMASKLALGGMFPEHLTTPSLNKGMAGKQKGAVDFKYLGDTFEQKKQKIEKLLGTKMFTEKPSAEAVTQAALSEGKDGKGFNLLESGSSLAAAKRNSALIQGVSRIMQHEVNKADLDIREHVLPTEKALRKLARKELEPLMKVFLSEARTKTKYSAEQLAGFGLSVEQLAAYSEVRRMLTETLRIENEAREVQGKKPVTELEYYTSARWHGDFRQDFHDASGKHVWSLAGTSARDLRKQREALMKQFPELVPGDERTVRHSKGDIDPVSMYKGMLEILGDNDAAVQRIKEWYETEIGAEVGNTLAQEKHFKAKAGVRGFVGDRPGRSGVSEALDFFQQQIQYAKNGVRWSAMQRAGADIKAILSNEDLLAQQPNNVAYVREYLRHNLGFNEAKAIAGLEDSLRNVGVSPNQVSEVLGSVKSAWVTQKLVASPGFMLSNLVQSSAILPHMADITVKYGGNPLAGLAGGMVGLAQLGFGHLMGLGGKHFQQARKGLMYMSTDFFNEALKYAEDNGVTSRSTYDESPIKSSFNPVARGVDIAAKASITTPETLLRGFTFTAFASQLESSGKFKNNLEIFRKAEELTNIALGDYRAGERPMVFAKGGMAGDLAGTLSTFPMNYYNQWNWAAREARRGNMAPVLTMFVVQTYIAGAMGLPGFQDLDKTFELVKAWAAENNPKLWKKIKDWGPRQLVMDTFGDDALYGNASTKTGLALTSRVAAPSVTDMVGMPGGIVADIGKQAINIGSAVVNPTAENVAKATIESAPVGMQGALETKAFRDTTSRPVEGGQLYLKRGKPTPEGDFIRTPEDEAVRAMGLRTQREALTKDETYRLQQRSIQTREAANASFDKFYNAARKNNVDDMRSYARLYTELTGKAITNKQIENHIIKEYTSGTQKALTAARQLEAMKAAKRMMDILEENK